MPPWANRDFYIIFATVDGISIRLYRPRQVSLQPHLRPPWKHLSSSHLSWGTVTMATTAAADCIFSRIMTLWPAVRLVLNCWIRSWSAMMVNTFLLFPLASFSLPLCSSQGASALFDMIEYYESATHLNISFNKHIGTRGWQAAAHMMRKVRDRHPLQWMDAG